MNSPPIPQMTTLDVFHDCNRVAWYWAVSSAKGREVRGVDLLYAIDKGMADSSDGVVKGGSGKGQYGNQMVNMVAFEFDSLGWEA
jgi:hypothetical protein